MTLLDLLIELDVGGNIVLTGENRTISATLGRRLARGEASALEEALCEALDYFEPDHCRRAFGRSNRAPGKTAR